MPHIHLVKVASQNMNNFITEKSVWKEIKQLSLFISVFMLKRCCNMADGDLDVH
jgi:hypothetical protein